jgi:cyclic-di-GMP phosphodiesterase TipF (flagellum assembly factor)
MPSMTNVLISLSYAILSAAMALVLKQFANLDFNTAVIAGAGMFLMCAQLHGLVGRRQDRRLLENEIVSLQRGNLVLSQDVEGLRQQSDRKTEDLEDLVTQKNQKVLAEVRVLESLMRQMADGLERKARATALAAVEEAEKAKASGDEGAISKLINSLENSLTELESQESDFVGLRDSVLDAMSEEELLEVVRASLKENRVDLYLQPIVTLPGREVAFYEALTRLRSQAGEMIFPTQYLGIAEPAGLMSVIDNLLLFRCVQMVRRIAEQQATISIVCNISLSSVKDRDFFPYFLEFMEINKDLCANLVFEFSQTAFASCGDYEKEKLDKLGELGFRLSMDGVTSLDLDLPDLRQRNFRFLKVNSRLFMNTLNGAGGRVNVDEFQELLGHFGIDMIVERLEEEASLTRVIECRVAFGQGFLFGEPRPLDEVESRIHSANVPSTLFDEDMGSSDQPKLAYHAS